MARGIRISRQLRRWLEAGNGNLYVARWFSLLWSMEGQLNKWERGDLVERRTALYRAVEEWKNAWLWQVRLERLKKV